MTQHEKAARFRALHDDPGTFVIPNPWDIASSKMLAGLGFQALATSSAAAACAIGRRDGGLTRDQALEHARMIVGATDLPVSADLEKGFGTHPRSWPRRSASRPRPDSSGARLKTRQAIRSVRSTTMASRSSGSRRRPKLRVDFPFHSC